MVLTALRRDIGVVDVDAEAFVGQNVSPVDSVNVTQMWVVADEHVASHDLCPPHTHTHTHRALVTSV